MMASASLLSASQQMISQSHVASHAESQSSQADESTAQAPSEADAGGTNADGAAYASSYVADFELDELNRQPVMITLMRCVSQLSVRNLTGEDSAGSGMPFWLSKLRLKIGETSSLNTRLLIAKLVHNMRHQLPHGAPDSSALEETRKALLGRGRSVVEMARLLKMEAPAAHPPKAEEDFASIRKAAVNYRWMAEESIFVDSHDFITMQRSVRRPQPRASSGLGL